MGGSLLLGAYILGGGHNGQTSISHKCYAEKVNVSEVIETDCGPGWHQVRGQEKLL